MSLGFVPSIRKELRKRKKNRTWYKKCRSIFSKSVIDDKKVLFSCFFGRQFSDSPKAIYIQMLNDSRFKDYSFVWAFTNAQEHSEIPELQDSRTTLVQLNTDAFLEQLYSSKYWVLNYKTTPTYLKRDEQVFVQCWHGTPLKRLGRDIHVGGNAATDLKKIHASYLEESSKYDFFISPSRYATDKFTSSFGLDELNKEDIVLEVGYPRNDALAVVNPDDISRIKEELGVPSDKKVLLYCPTFRDNQYTFGVGHTYELGINLLRLKEALSDQYVLLLRLHYLIANKYDFGQFTNFVYDVSHYDDVNDLYKIADILVTDYSSVFFDFAVLRRPILFYMYDLDEYQSQLRDFYLSLDELPGKIVTDETSLINCLKEGPSAHFDERVSDSFVSRFCYLEDGHAAARVINKVFANEVN